MNNPCNAKKFYDTEYEATRAAIITSHEFGTEMIPYRHNSHWHIANKHKSLRSKNRKFNRTYCEPCDQYMKPGRWGTHIKFERHKFLERKRKEEAV